MKLLAIDTVTECCSAALWCDGQVDERSEIMAQGHAAHILGMVQTLLDGAGLGLRDLDGLAFDRGPGSFTGVRIGAGVAQGLAFGAGLMVYPISSLATLAASTSAARVIAALDARMQQVYWGCFERDAGGGLTAFGAEAVDDPRLVTPPWPDWCAVGNGWQHYALALGDFELDHDADRLPRASRVAELGAAAARRSAGCAPDAVVPAYVRNRVVAEACNR